MKTKSAFVAIACGLLLPVSARTFTSADGERTIEADLIDYRPASDTVVISYKGKSARQSVKASAFSEADQAYFKEFLKGKAMRESLVVTSTEAEERSEDEGEIYTYDRLSSHYKVAVRNSGKASVEGLNAKYDVYVLRYDKEGQRQVEVESGEVSLDPIPVNLNALFDTDPVKVTLGCETSSSCPTCEKHADSVRRERVMGLRVRLYNDEDELMSEYYSSSSLRSVAEKEDEKERT